MSKTLHGTCAGEVNLLSIQDNPHGVWCLCLRLRIGTRGNGLSDDIEVFTNQLSDAEMEFLTKLGVQRILIISPDSGLSKAPVPVSVKFRHGHVVQIGSNPFDNHPDVDTQDMGTTIAVCRMAELLTEDDLC